MQPWDPEWAMSQKTAQHLIQACFAQLTIRTIQKLGEGWDNLAYLVNKQIVFRFPKRSEGLQLLQTEVSLLPLIAKQLPLPIPQPKWVASVPYPPYFLVGYTLLPGETGCSLNLPSRMRVRAAEPLARFLSALHHINPVVGKNAGLGKERFNRLDLVPMLKKIENQLQELQIPKDSYDHVLQIDDLLSTKHCIVHGDFYARHILFNVQLNLCGVIDWGDADLGYPAIDLAIAHSFLPPEAHDAFRRTYGPINENDWQRARLRALFSATTSALYAQKTGDKNLEQEAKQALGFLKFNP